MQANSNTHSEPDPPVPDNTAFHDFDEAMNWLDQYFDLTNAINTVTDEPPPPAPPPQPQPIVIAVRDLIALPEDAVLVVVSSPSSLTTRTAH
ncbi:hypothetical protein L227DRAFT_574109 [Lentinus tigrinus ALCF2SS1-6]|uniref:Uncharacterized protein n=1 Tax=Lentinus tigrinus ALCF2SS1-6 TaxID=1328759 RepID=A0A5C2SJK2_9APHY|nr:hypothetical protein L227DRAFT_574109 [Lentinus tigrinus ALCF2SS1-6]